jgi:hypothetical protein
MRGVLAIPFFLAGCKHGADVTGSVAGESFEAGAAWWGDSFICSPRQTTTAST